MTKKLKRVSALLALAAALALGAGAGGASAASWGSLQPDASWGE